MSRDSRVAWRARERELQAQYARLEDAGVGQDDPRSKAAYTALEDHHDSRTVGDVVGGAVDQLRGGR